MLNTTETVISWLSFGFIVAAIAAVIIAVIIIEYHTQKHIKKVKTSLKTGNRATRVSKTARSIREEVLANNQQYSFNNY